MSCGADAAGRAGQVPRLGLGPRGGGGDRGRRRGGRAGPASSCRWPTAARARSTPSAAPTGRRPVTGPLGTPVDARLADGRRRRGRRRERPGLRPGPGRRRRGQRPGGRDQPRHRRARRRRHRRGRPPGDRQPGRLGDHRRRLRRRSRSSTRYAPFDGRDGRPEVLVACDVRTAFRDAAVVFGPQKGASPEQIVELTGRLRPARGAYRERYGVDLAAVEGSGAAGGLGGAPGRARAPGSCPGFGLIAEHTGLDEAIRSADAVVTGEGKLDAESFNGKVVGGVLELARAVRRARRWWWPASWTTRSPAGRRACRCSSEFGSEASWGDPLGCVTQAAAAVDPPGVDGSSEHTDRGAGGAAARRHRRHRRGDQRRPTGTTARASAPPGTPLGVVRPTTTEQVQAVLRWATRAPRAGRAAGRADRPVRRRPTRSTARCCCSMVRMNRIVEIDEVDQVADRRARRDQRRPVARGRRRRAVLPAGPVLVGAVDDRRQPRHQRRRAVLREVRRHGRLRPRPRGRARRAARWSASAAGPPRAWPATTSPG